MKMPPKTAELFADLYLERLSGEKICAWAVSALEADFDSEALRVLAGMSFERAPGYFETEPIFRTALRELHLAIPASREEALRAYAQNVAEDLLAGRASVEQALHDIHRSVVGPLSHPADLMPWCYLWEGLAPDGSYGELSKEQLERAAREFAEKWLAGLNKETP